MENSLLKFQICSIEQAKNLKELGLRQNSLFYYVNNWLGPRKTEIDDGEMVITSEEKLITRKKGRERGTEVEFVSAYTETELRAFFPYGLTIFIESLPELPERLFSHILEEGIPVDEYNENFKEFFNINDQEHEL